MSSSSDDVSYQCNDINEAFGLVSTIPSQGFDIEVDSGRYDVTTQLRSENSGITTSGNDTFSLVLRGNSPYNTRIQNFLDSSTPFIHSSPNGDLDVIVSNFTYNAYDGVEQKFGYFSGVSRLELSNLRLNLNNRYIFNLLTCYFWY